MMNGNQLVLQKKELDKANKDKKKVFPPTFHVELKYTEEAKAAQGGASKATAAKKNVRRKYEMKYPSLMNL
jgi:hypothetical protein